MCAFSPTSRITQRDGRRGTDAPGSRDRTGRLHRDVHGRPAAGRNPGLPDDSGLASASRPRIARGPQAPGRQPGHPGARSSSPAASGRPGRAPVHPLRRDPRSAPPPGGRSPCGRHDGRGRQRTTAIQEDPVGGYVRWAMMQSRGRAGGSGGRSYVGASADHYRLIHLRRSREGSPHTVSSPY